MKEQHELDKFLRQKFEGREFEFHEAFWEEAETMIAAEQGMAARGRFWWLSRILGGAGVLAMLGLVSWWMLDQDPKPGKQPAAEFYLSPTLPLGADNQEGKNEFNLIVPYSLSSQIDEASFRSETNPSNSSSISPISSPSEFSPTSPTHSQASSEVSSSDGKQAEPFSQPTASQGLDAVASPSQLLKLGRQLPSVSAAGSSKELAEEALQMASARIEVDSLSPVYDALQIEGNAPLSEFRFPVRPKDSRHSLGLSLGGTLIRNFRRDGFNLGPVVGLTYEYSLSSRLRLSSGLLLRNRAGLNSSLGFVSSTYSFGREDVTVALQPLSLQQLELPLQLSARLAQRHYLSLGGNVAYLLGVRSRISTSASSQLGTTLLSEENAWGYRQLYTDWELSLSLAYRVYLGRGLNLWLEYQHGLTDLSPDVVWNHTQKDRSRQLRLRLSLDLFRL
jgi:hypothetical protein